MATYVTVESYGLPDDRVYIQLTGLISGELARGLIDLLRGESANSPVTFGDWRRDVYFVDAVKDESEQGSGG